MAETVPASSTPTVRNFRSRPSERGELRKAGVKLKLGGQPFQLLTVLSWNGLAK